ncbi:MAG: orotidine-5'-phosphate decarboxylase [Flavobacteriales bacterium]|nr:orotidine-5'-phosphate decarboxylase [Flavobacteriales bacterium]NNK81242.1 orotidine-5'-phosphate decarboxylase [Flavobacteriales bacterium]
MTRSELIEQIHLKKSFLCVGLDPDEEKIPEHILEGDDWIFRFNKSIIDAVEPYCVAFKPNTAFYECHGAKGWEQLESTVEYIKEKYPHQFVIADAKRGDIGNTSRKYAKAFFEKIQADAITVAPYMGEDSVTPFLGWEGKWVILLGLTSNKGSKDFQNYGEPDLYLEVISKAIDWAGEDQMMIVAGATRGYQLAQVRKAAGKHFLLVPGVGAQGGSLEEVVENAFLDKDIGLLVNSSRGILYASSGRDFEQAAAEAAEKLSAKMSLYI